MSLLYQGKTKDVFTRPDGNLEFHFKDDATGYILDGKPVFNSGYDKVVGQIPGKGQISCKFTEYLFKIFEANGIPTDFVAMGPQPNVMIVKPAKLLEYQTRQQTLRVLTKFLYLETVFRNEIMGSWCEDIPLQSLEID